MSEWFLKKIYWLVGIFAIAFLFGLIALVSNLEIKDVDLWLHLAVGKYIIQSFSIPHVDILSCTIANSPWINHEWLFQTIVYSMYNMAGVDGLIALKVGIVFLTFVLLLLSGYTSETKIGPIVVLLLVLLVYQTRLTLRPDMFSLLFFTLTIIILRHHLNKWWSLWAIILIQIFWTNIHGFFIFGPILILLGLCGEWTKRYLKLPFEWNTTGRLPDNEYKRLKWLFLGVILACLVNPYFIKGAWYPIGVLFSLGGESQIFFDQIQELQKPLQWDNLFSLQPYLHFKLLIVISLFSFVFNYRKVNMSIVFLWIFLLLFSLSAVRNVVFFALAAYFAFLANYRYISIEKFLPSQCRNLNFKTICSVVVTAIFIIWIINYGNRSLLKGYYDFDKFERKSVYEGISLRNFPYKATDFIVEHNIKGNFFNDFNAGAYLLGRVFPNIKVYIDGRTEVYGAKFFKKYNDIWQGNTELFDEEVKRYQLTGAFLSYVYVPAPAKIMRYLYSSKNWILVYFDYDASIFLRNIPENRQWINRFRINLKEWQTPQADLLRIGTHKVQPYRYVNRAYALFNMGLPRKAQQEAVEALRIESYNVKAQKLLGRIYNEQGKYSEAFEILRKAKLLEPDDMNVRYQIAFSLFHLDKIEHAKEQCQRVLSKNPNDADALLLLSKIHAKEQSENRP